MKITNADKNDIPELYRLQLLCFESEAEIIGSRMVPALMETEEENAVDFDNWTTLKLINDDNAIIGAIRYRHKENMIDVGRLMVHPDYRKRGLAQKLLAEVDAAYQDKTKELYTCTKSWINIRLYEKMGYVKFEEHKEESGLSFVYMRKAGEA